MFVFYALTIFNGYLEWFLVSIASDIQWLFKQ